MSPGPSRLLEVNDLKIEFPTPQGVVKAVRGVDFSVAPGEVLGLVGESASGKSVTASSILGLVRPPGRIVSGDIRWKGKSLLDEANVQRVRGREIALIPQEPMRSLNPLAKVGNQIVEVLGVHTDLSHRQARERAVDLLSTVGIAAPKRRADQYPHELSGGMCQRVLIALALASEPELVIADEPTTSLDVTIQAQILDVLKDLRERMGLAVLFITHDLGLVAELCDSILVMYSGLIMERGSVDQVFSRPIHPYTAALTKSRPSLKLPQRRLPAIEGSPPDPIRPPTGCPFHPRCEFATDQCRAERPALATYAEGSRAAACWEPLLQPAATR